MLKLFLFKSKFLRLSNEWSPQFCESYFGYSSFLLLFLPKFSAVSLAGALFKVFSGMEFPLKHREKLFLTFCLKLFTPTLKRMPIIWMKNWPGEYSTSQLSWALQKVPTCFSVYCLKTILVYWGHQENQMLIEPPGNYLIRLHRSIPSNHQVKAICNQ